MFHFFVTFFRFFEKKLKNYLDSDIHYGTNIPLQSVFGNENIEDLIKKHPDKFSIPKKYTPANMYFWRGFFIENMSSGRNNLCIDLMKVENQNDGREKNMKFLKILEKSEHSIFQKMIIEN